MVDIVSPSALPHSPFKAYRKYINEFVVSFPIGKTFSLSLSLCIDLFLCQMVIILFSSERAFNFFFLEGKWLVLLWFLIQYLWELIFGFSETCTSG